MKFTDPGIRDRLAAEYVLGTMPGRSRRRFEAHLRLDPDLRLLVAEWEARLTPMASSLRGQTPPRRVWQAIQNRIRTGQSVNANPGWWSSLAFWRAATGFASAAMLMLALVLVWPGGPDRSLMVVVMDDMRTETPAMTVSWEPGDKADKMLRLRVIGHAEMAPDTAWELWMLPGEGRPAVSLGLITTHELQTLRVSEPIAGSLDRAWGLGMTVEPAGGSPTGQPTNPMLYMGECVKT